MVTSSLQRRLPCLVLIGLCGASYGATSQLRIASYNIEADINGVTTPRSGLSAAIEDIGTTATSASAARPVDILGLEETTSNATTVSPIVSSLNSYYSGIGSTAVYASPTLQGLSSGNNVSGGNGPNALIYNTTTLKLLGAAGVSTAGGTSGNGVDRQILRYEFQPIGSAVGANTFYVYVEHYKSGTGTDNATARNEEAGVLRTDSATLGASAHVIYTGDFNTDPVQAGTTESTFKTLEAAGAGQAIDPLNNVGKGTPASYTDSSSTLTYRDDYELQTSPMINDATGVELIAGSYSVLGNNNGTLTTTTLAQTLQAASDHLPTFADYSYTTVPEPAALTGLALAGLVGLRRRR